MRDLKGSSLELQKAKSTMEDGASRMRCGCMSHPFPGVVKIGELVEEHEDGRERKPPAA